MVTLYGDGLWRGGETVLVLVTPDEDPKLFDYSEYGMWAAEHTRGCRNLGDMQLRKVLVAAAEDDERVSWYGSGMTEDGKFGGDFSRAERHPGYRGDVVTAAELLEAL